MSNGSDGHAHPDILQILQQNIERLPVPTTPQVRNRRGEELGLAILELSLRLAHVNRLSEHLTLEDRTHVGREVSLDVDLTALSSRQQHAVRADAPEGTLSQLWIPVSRHDRANLAPVVVRDNTGTILPRLTNHETTRVTASALVFLFRMLLEANPTSVVEDNALYRLRHDHHRERWLIESAIARIVDEGCEWETGSQVRAAGGTSGLNRPGSPGGWLVTRPPGRWPRS